MTLNLWDMVAVVVISLLASLAGAAMFDRFASSKGPDFVTFDVTRLMNAQRAVASRVLAGDQDAVSTISRVGKDSMRTVEKFARGRMVVVKQAVVRGEVEDITMAVLEDLGLPTDVPTATLPQPAPGETTSLSLDPAVRTTEEARERIAQMRRDYFATQAANNPGEDDASAALLP